MAKAVIVSEPKYSLELSYDEARFLKELLQNYLGEGHELPQMLDIRTELFYALEGVIENVR